VCNSILLLRQEEEEGAASGCTAYTSLARAVLTLLWLDAVDPHPFPGKLRNTKLPSRPAYVDVSESALVGRRCVVQHMFCLSFKLSAAVAFAAEGNYDGDGTRRPHHMEEPVVTDAPPPSKRIRVADEGAKVS